MRTVKVDDDHVARYENTGRKRYAFTVVHEATGRELIQGVAEHAAGAPDVTIRMAARRELAVRDATRRAKSEAFARGEPVVGAPAAQHVPPLQRAQMASPGGLEVSAAMPVRIIRDAYNTAVRNNTWITAAALEAATLAVGRDLLIGATDEQILKIARGQATLEGSLRTGVTYKELA